MTVQYWFFFPERVPLTRTLYKNADTSDLAPAKDTEAKTRFRR